VAYSFMSSTKFDEMDALVTIGLRIEGVNVENPQALVHALKDLPKRAVEFAQANEIDLEDLLNFLSQVVENSVEAHEAQ